MRSVILIMFGLLLKANGIFAQVNSADDFSKKERFREKLEAQMNMLKRDWRSEERTGI